LLLSIEIKAHLREYHELSGKLGFDLNEYLLSAPSRTWARFLTASEVMNKSSAELKLVIATQAVDDTVYGMQPEIQCDFCNTF